MMGTRASSETIPFEGYCDDCDRTVSREFPASQQAGGNGETRVFCGGCDHPTLCEVVPGDV